MSRLAVVANAAIVGERPTGLGVYTTHVIRALAALGERLVVYSSMEEAFPGDRIGLRPAPVAARPEHGWIGHLVRLVWGQVGFRRSARRDGADVLFHPVPEPVWASGIPQLATIHDLFPLYYPNEYPRLRYFFRYWLPLALRSCQAVVTVSEATRRDVLDIYRLEPERVHVGLCGYDRQRFSPDGPVVSVGEPYALYVGNVMPHKNLLRLVDAFSDATRSLTGRLVIRGWGRPRYVRALRRRIVAAGIERRVDWKAYAPAPELPALYRGARMLLLPSLHEGFGLPALEAMACGTPVITSNTSSLPEVVGDAAVLVDPRDTRALAQAIGRLLTDDVLYKDLRARGVDRAASFSWERTALVVQAAIRAAAGVG